MNALLNLSAADLRALATAAEAGQLPGFSALAVGRYIAEPGPVASALVKLAARGGAVAPTLELLAAAAVNRRLVEDAVQLVITGPDDRTSRMTPVVVRQLFRSAVESVWVCGYRPYKARHIFQDLARPGIRVRMLLDIGRPDGRSEQKTVRDFVAAFRDGHWPTGAKLPEIWYEPKALMVHASERAVAHAKCIIVDSKSLFVTSANFTEAAQSRNLEVGLLAESETLAIQMVSHLETLIKEGRIRRAAQADVK